MSPAWFGCYARGKPPRPGASPGYRHAVDERFETDLRAGLPGRRIGCGPRIADARRRGARRRSGPAAALDREPARARRRRHRHGEDQDAAGDRRAALGRGGAGVRRGRQGRPLRARAADRRRRSEGRRTGGVPRLDGRTPLASGRTALADGRRRRPGPGDGRVVRARAARQGARPERDPDRGAVPRVPLLRRPRPAAARPGRPPHDAAVPHVGRGQAGARGVRRHLEGIGGRRAAVDPHARGGGGGRVLRRAGVRRRRPAAPRRRPRGDQPARARRRDGPSPSVLDVHALAARAPVRDAARDRRHGRTRAGVLLRRGAPAVRRRLRRAARTDRAHRAADPFEGRRACSS